jgi:hypothetical protein
MPGLWPIEVDGDIGHVVDPNTPPRLFRRSGDYDRVKVQWSIGQTSGCITAGDGDHAAAHAEGGQAG